jgi:hypothetical protein
MKPLACYREFVRRGVLISVALLALAAVPAAAGTAAKSGLRGTVTLFPASPVCIEGDPCSKPAAHALLHFRRDGRVAARVETRADGTYRVILAPGLYRVVAPRYVRGTGVSPKTVLVPRGRIARIDLEIDSGIQ